MMFHGEPRNRKNNVSRENDNRKGEDNMPENQATQYITISVAEYHYLTKAAALLEVVINDPTYNHDAVAAVSATIQDMRRTAEAGAAE